MGYHLYSPNTKSQNTLLHATIHTMPKPLTTRKSCRPSKEVADHRKEDAYHCNEDKNNNQMDEEVKVCYFFHSISSSFRLLFCFYFVIVLGLASLISLVFVPDEAGNCRWHHIGIFGTAVLLV